MQNNIYFHVFSDIILCVCVCVSRASVCLPSAFRSTENGQAVLYLAGDIRLCCSIPVYVDLTLNFLNNNNDDDHKKYWRRNTGYTKILEGSSQLLSRQLCV